MENGQQRNPDNPNIKRELDIVKNLIQRMSKYNKKRPQTSQVMYVAKNQDQQEEEKQHEERFEEREKGNYRQKDQRRKYDNNYDRNRNEKQYQPYGKKEHRRREIDPDYVRSKPQREYSGQQFEEFEEEVKEQQLDLRQVKHKELAQVLTRLFKEKQAVCPICIIRIHYEAKVWNCNCCYQPFHLGCIQKWIKNTNSVNQSIFNWSCPNCNKLFQQQMPDYRCFCGKTKDPEHNRYAVPHSCQSKCSKTRGKNCNHPCPMDCHPGPCPECQVKGLQIQCHCAKFSKQISCSEDFTSFACGSDCDKTLNCGLHKCTKKCHPGPCQPCPIQHQITCYCGAEQGTYPCGTDKFQCNKPCGKKLDCEKHVCPSQKCHEKCEPCLLKPELITHCPCQRYPLAMLGVERTSCLDAVPTCMTPLNNVLGCGHKSKALCGDKNIRCMEKVQVFCRCTKSSQITECYKSEEEFLCERVCKKKKSCQVHTCNTLCCPKTQDFHLCLKVCQKPLGCKNHQCELFCHIGMCQPCPIVVIEPILCFCGKTAKQPPNKCGTSRPECNEQCLKDLDCGHKCQSLCHSGDCPACNELVRKQCTCGKNEVEISCSKTATCTDICGKELECGHACNQVCEKDCSHECKQRCCKKRPCGHQCQDFCHFGKECPLKPCKTSIRVVCSCGNRDAFVECQATSIILQKELKCNHVCANLKRFGGFYQQMVDVKKAYYPGLLLKFTNYNLQYLQKLEKKLEEFLIYSAEKSLDITFGKSEYSELKKQALQILLSRHYKFEVHFTKAVNKYLFTVFKSDDTILPKPLLSEYFKKKDYTNAFEAKLKAPTQQINGKDIEQMELSIKEYKNDYYVEKHFNFWYINFWEESHAEEVLKRIKKLVGYQSVNWILEVNQQAQKLEQEAPEIQIKAIMCDPEEQEERIKNQDLSIFEQDSFYAFEVHPSVLVRKYVKGKHYVPRSPECLRQTFKWLMQFIDADHEENDFKKPVVDGKEGEITYEHIWEFVSNRLKQVRVEMKELELKDEALVRKMIRFYAVSMCEVRKWKEVKEEMAESLELVEGKLNEELGYYAAVMWGYDERALEKERVQEEQYSVYLAMGSGNYAEFLAEYKEVKDYVRASFMCPFAREIRERLLEEWKEKSAEELWALLHFKSMKEFSKFPNSNKLAKLFVSKRHDLL